MFAEMIGLTFEDQMPCNIENPVFDLVIGEKISSNELRWIMSESWPELYLFFLLLPRTFHSHKQERVYLPAAYGVYFFAAILSTKATAVKPAPV